MEYKDFTERLLDWYRSEDFRLMPWKGEKDPYKIYLSEVILQQTRVEQGMPYYLRFIENYPTVSDLANADEKMVFKLWEGLGYYRRCTNLLQTAKIIVKDYQGLFPPDFDELQQLKGIGSYTAAAIASFAFNLPYAVVDGNVLRVLSRCFGVSMAIDSIEGKRVLSALAQKLISKDHPADFNQAIMDFGATICKPFAPACKTCCMQDQCIAYHSNSVDRLPVKQKSKERKRRYFSYFVFKYGSQLMVRERSDRDIWAFLHEFYLVETPSVVQWNSSSVKEWLTLQWNINDPDIEISISPLYRQQLTHQEIRASFILLNFTQLPFMLRNENWYDSQSLTKLAFPGVIRNYLKTLSLY